MEKLIKLQNGNMINIDNITKVNFRRELKIFRQWFIVNNYNGITKAQLYHLIEKFHKVPTLRLLNMFGIGFDCGEIVEEIMDIKFSSHNERYTKTLIPNDEELFVVIKDLYGNTLITRFEKTHALTSKKQYDEIYNILNTYVKEGEINNG